MNSYLRVLAALSVVTLSQHAAANPTLKSVTPTFHQAGGGTVQAGLVVEASTSLPVLVIAGGFTITCTTGSLVQSAENTATFVSFLGPSGKVNVPEVVPSPYPIPGWLSDAVQRRGTGRNQPVGAHWHGWRRRKFLAHSGGSAVCRRCQADRHLPVEAEAMLHAHVCDSVTA
jgi:hypothetical protein